MKRMKLIYLLVLCLLLVIPSQGQISLQPASFHQNSDLLLIPESRASDSGYIVFTYDDGTAENYCAWQLAGNMNAVKFNIQSYPASIAGARVYVGNGSFPVGGNIINQPFLVSVYSADGENGLPGTLIDSISASVTNYEWVIVTGLNAFVTGDFYIVVTQLSDSPDCIPIGVDETQPKYNISYSRNIYTGNPWVLSTYQDMMINALISTTVGMDEPEASKEVGISPNPANESVVFKFPSEIKSLSVINATGQIIYKADITNQPVFIINTSHYLSGIYYIRFTTTKGDSFIRKMVVVH